MDSLYDFLAKLVIENRNSLKAELIQKIKEIQDNLYLEIGHIVATAEQLETKIDQPKEANNHFDLLNLRM